MSVVSGRQLLWLVSLVMFWPQKSFLHTDPAPASCDRAPARTAALDTIANSSSNVKSAWSVFAYTAAASATRAAASATPKGARARGRE